MAGSGLIWLLQTLCGPCLTCLSSMNVTPMQVCLPENVGKMTQS